MKTWRRPPLSCKERWHRRCSLRTAGRCSRELIMISSGRIRKRTQTAAGSHHFFPLPSQESRSGKKGKKNSLLLSPNGEDHQKFFPDPLELAVPTQRFAALRSRPHSWPHKARGEKVLECHSTPLEFVSKKITKEAHFIQKTIMA